MTIGLVQFPGSLGIDDFKRVLQGFYQVDVQVIWHLEDNIHSLGAIIIPGGYAFGDFPRPGVIAGNSEILKHISEYAYNGGLVFGFGNGFQILCEAGLLPGTFSENTSKMHNCDLVYVKADNNDTALTMMANKDRALSLPISHHYGRYYLDKEVLSIMRQNHQILYRYCDKYSRISEAFNPDGSIENIAGVCNVNKNIYGLMLHPERAVEDDLGSTDGRIIFEGLLKVLNKKPKTSQV